MFRFLTYLSAAMLATAPAQAAVIFSSDNGWYYKDGTHEVDNPNTVTRNMDFRSFYSFDIASGTANADQLFVTFIGGNGQYFAPDGYLYLQFYDYLGDIDSLLDGSGGKPAYDDLGKGFVSSTYLFNLDVEGSMPEFTIQVVGALLEQFNSAAAAGGKVAFGATVTNKTGHAWSDSSALPAAYLTSVQVAPAVPEPAAWALLIAGFGAIGLSLRRRRPLASV